MDNTVGLFITKLAMMQACIFCSPEALKIFAQNDLAFAIWDAFPVAKGHALVIPKRHVAEYFGLSSEELIACHELLVQARHLILEQDPSVQGFNIGLNAGEAAGQTVFHCHFHLIPRRLGDVAEPRGGVRNVIPGKGSY